MSMAKLVKMSKSLAFAKAGDDYIPLSEIAESFMPTFSHWGLLLEQRSNFTELQGVIRRIFLEAQCELLRHDVRKMTVEVGNASKMLMSRFTSCFPGLPVQRYFVALSRFVPGMVVANRLSASAFRSIVSGIIDAPADWVAAGRGRYHVIAGVYTLQAAKSRVLDEGRLVKSFLHCFAM